MIRVRGLTKIFSGTGKTVDNVDLDIREGELFCLAGHNGAGKTTLIKMLCGLILPTGGEIIINGHDITRESERINASIGLVTGDERSFYWRLTGRQNLDFFAALYGVPSLSRKETAEKLFKTLDIREPDKIFQRYPSGIKQRLSVARALLNDPKVIFIDELTKNLDPVSAGELRTFIREELVNKRKKTVFFSSHNLDEIKTLADKIAFMREGKVIANGIIDEIKKSMGAPDKDIKELYPDMMGGRPDVHK